MRRPDPYARLSELGLVLPRGATPVASYVPAVRTGSLLFVSGQLPFDGPALVATGTVGDSVDQDAANAAARQCALNVLAAVEAAVGLDAVTRVVRLVGFVASTPDFTGQPAVVNGASDLMVEVFGDAGRHSRSAVGVAALPLGAAVEVEATLEVTSGERGV